MKIKQATIRNFRSIKDQTIDFNDRTIFIGSNGAGKSTVLKALDAFFTMNFKPEKEDYFAHNEANSIEITLVFNHFTDVEAEEFGSRIHNGESTIIRIFGGEGNEEGNYQGLVKGQREFQVIRGRTKVTEKKSAYAEISSKFGLPTAKTAEDIDEALTQWETENPDSCELMPDGGKFFGFKAVGNGKLQKAANFILIKAVSDVADEADDQKNSAIGQLMDIIVRSALRQNAAITEFQGAVQTEYKALTDPRKFPALGSLEASLTTSLQTYYQDVGVVLDWKEAPPLQLPPPQAKISFKEDGLAYPVGSAGNGIQRAFIISLLHQLLLAKTTTPVVANDNPEQAEVADETPAVAAKELLAKLPSIILAIEEPELYQHPTKQWHFAQVLKQLSSGALESTFGDVQVIFCTHSPTFVALEDFDSTKIIKKEICEKSGVKHSIIQAAEMRGIKEIVAKVNAADPAFYTDVTMRARLHFFGAELSEGYFADGVVLVEGPSDKAALEAVAAAMGKSFAQHNIAVLSAGGKPNMDRPAAIFQELGIPIYLVWDTDKESTEKEKGASKENLLKLNRVLQRLAGYDEKDLIDYPEKLEGRCACFVNDLFSTLEEELKGDLSAPLEQAMAQMGYREKNKAIKNPYVIKHTIEALYKAEKRSATLEAVVCHALENLAPKKKTQKATLQADGTVAAMRG